jgi:hypothetical protein
MDVDGGLQLKGEVLLLRFSGMDLVEGRRRDKGRRLGLVLYVAHLWMLWNGRMAELQEGGEW